MRLFRSSFLLSKAEQRELQFSIPTRFTPVFWPLMTCLSGFLAVFLWWCFYATLPINIEARGLVISLSGLREVMAIGTGKVVHMNKNSGDTVAAGELILKLSDPAAEAAFESKRRLYLSQVSLLNKRSNAIKKAMDEEVILRESELKTVELELSRIENIEGEMSSAMKILSETTEDSNKKRLKLVRELSSEWETQRAAAKKLLKNGNISSTNYLQVFDNYSNRIRTLLDAKTANTNDKVENERLKYELSRLMADVDSQRVKLLEVTNAIKETKRQRTLELAEIEISKVEALNGLLEEEYINWIRSVAYSPYKGKILSIRKSLGQIFSEGESLALMELDNQAQQYFLVISEKSHTGNVTFNVAGNSLSVSLYEGNFNMFEKELQQAFNQALHSTHIQVKRHDNRFVISSHDRNIFKNLEVTLGDFEIYDYSNIPVFADLQQIGDQWNNKEWINLALVPTKDAKRIQRGAAAIIKPDSEDKVVGGSLASEVISVGSYLSTNIQVESLIGSSEFSTAISEDGASGVAVVLSLGNALPPTIGFNEKDKLKFPLSQGSTTTSYIQVGSASPIEVIIPFFTSLTTKRN